jgi:hypothetical protein
MSDLFDKVKQEIEKGISTVNIKSKEVLESLKIKKQVETLQEQAEIATAELGQMVYGMFIQSNLNQEKIEEKCQVILVLNRQLKEKEIELNQLHLETGAALGKIYCINCKAEICEGTQFCGQCGEKVPD